MLRLPQLAVSAMFILSDVFSHPEWKKVFARNQQLAQSMH